MSIMNMKNIKSNIISKKSLVYNNVLVKYRLPN